MICIFKLCWPNVIDLMEKKGAIIQLLQEQYQKGASRETLLVTAQMLLAELQQEPTPPVDMQKKVAVKLPSNMHATHTPTTIVPEQELNAMLQGGKEEERPTDIAVTWGIHSVNEIPTFAHQEKELFELNEKMKTSDFSLNERLNPGHDELGNTLKDTPIKDLKKAIGVNDRFLFINDLFRGDENMYERSIKTINAFHTLPEAEYWIQRELKVKIGWPENNATVHLFDQLVRRRFSRM